MGLGAHILRHTHDLANKGYIYGKDPEQMHDLIVKKLSPCLEQQSIITGLLKNILEVNDPVLQTEFLGKVYKNPVGIAAGMLKQPYGLKFWESLGVGYLEIGSVIKEPRKGNQNMPRIRRYPHQQTGGLTVVNQMGLPSEGEDSVYKAFWDRDMNDANPSIPVRGNFTNTPKPSMSTEEKIQDITQSMHYLLPYIDVVVINDSCPNTGESVQNEVKELISPIIESNKRVAEQHGIEVRPLLVKIGPLTSGDKTWIAKYPHLQDNSPDRIKYMLDTFMEIGVQGVVATNTAKEHIGLKGLSPMDKDNNPRGGMSGKELHERSLQTVSLIKEHVQSELKIVGLGGVGAGTGPKERRKSGADMMEAGADMVQMYTGIVNNITSPYFVNQGIANQRWDKMHRESKD